MAFLYIRNATRQHDIYTQQTDTHTYLLTYLYIYHTKTAHIHTPLYICIPFCLYIYTSMQIYIWGAAKVPPPIQTYCGFCIFHTIIYIYIHITYIEVICLYIYTHIDINRYINLYALLSIYRHTRHSWLHYSSFGARVKVPMDFPTSLVSPQEYLSCMNQYRYTHSVHMHTSVYI